MKRFSSKRIFAVFAHTTNLKTPVYAIRNPIIFLAMANGEAIAARIRGLYKINMRKTDIWRGNHLRRLQTNGIDSITEWRVDCLQRLPIIKNDQYCHIINLTEKGLQKGDLVRSLGMACYPIQVVWDQPTLEDFRRFEVVFDRLAETKKLLHCAANFRFTAFYCVDAMKHL